MCKIADRKVLSTAMRRAALLHVLFLTVWVLSTTIAAQDALDLDKVISRATEYVAQYESDLGNLIR